MQAYEGYFKNGQFYTAGRTIKIPEQRRVFITILEEAPIKSLNLNDGEAFDIELELRKMRLKKLKEAINLSTNEELPFISRSTQMRKPINLTDEE